MHLGGAPVARVGVVRATPSRLTSRLPRQVNPDERCARLAAQQYGLLCRDQARACGISDRQAEQRLASGRWIRVHPRVFAIHGTPDSWNARMMAVTLWSGEGTAASHTSAARLWGLQGIRRTDFEIVTPRRLPALAGVRIHQSFRLPPQDITKRVGINVTTIERTVLDLCAVCRPWESERALDCAVDTGLTSISRLRSLLERDGRRGRKGGARFRQLLNERDPETAAPKGVLASDFLRFMRSNGFPTPVPEYRIYGPDGFVADVDFAFPEKLLAFEIDGYAFHSGREAFARDRERDEILQAMGWRVVRVTASSLRRSTLALSIGKLLSI